ncbi:hypothetical protein HELRODRAFT_163038 [Helobdella robusta]|uniref:Dynein assembly factor 3 C-terminal domain-containing protein n=1 Tax=Helobdella robusta TaxID=6412 RepID=T1ETL4_HELRO|nr:hypothetical protein HELRODRAFT_163038 [Helobdella robusta]ESN96014.1 hypothetical protein HELRODRAFT_163038 [Helobdella robusta]
MVSMRGYWGDIILSPYVSFAIQSDNKEFFLRRNNKLVKTSQEVAQYNTEEIINMIFKKSSNVNNCCEGGEDDGGKKDGDDGRNEDDDAAHESKHYNGNDDDGFHKLDNVRINFLPTSIMEKIHDKSKFQELFHVVYVGTSHWDCINENLASIMKSPCNIYVETCKFLLDLKVDQMKSLNDNVNNLLAKVHCKGKDMDANDAHAHYTYAIQTSPTNLSNPSN